MGEEYTEHLAMASMDSPEKVIVHPLVLLSVVDHYNRVAQATRKRVVGVLLGEVSRGTVDITNCFAGKVVALCRRRTQDASLW